MLWLFKFLFRLKGWSCKREADSYVKQAIVIAAPHTSNWDAVLSVAAFDFMGIPIKFTLKKEWFRFPFKSLMRSIGGMPIDRSPKKPGENRRGMVEAMADLFKQHEVLHIMVAPEGTRSVQTEWKTGFWHAAKLAGVPILCGYLDFEKKVAGIGKIIHPDVFEEDMRTIMEFYKNIVPRHPEKFSLDKRFH